jgi:hypothetical protein
VFVRKALAQTSYFAFVVSAVVLASAQLVVSINLKPFNYARTNLLHSAFIGGVLWAYFLSLIDYFANNELSSYLLVGLGWGIEAVGIYFVLHKYPKKYEKKLIFQKNENLEPLIKFQLQCTNDKTFALSFTQHKIQQQISRLYSTSRSQFSEF